MGSSAEDDRAVGADVAVLPKGFAGLCVGIGEDMTATESAPGTVQPPYIVYSRMAFPYRSMRLLTSAGSRFTNAGVHKRGAFTA